MSRWNISHLVFYSKNQQHRILEFNIDAVTIITGASNTGKSALITSIDYCLGSSSCKVAAFVTERVTHIATKWTDGTTEFLVAREISKSGKASGNMFLTYGHEIEVPTLAIGLKGRGNIEEIKAVMEGLFGIKNVNDKDGQLTGNRISIRQLVPYLYLDKSVIDSDLVLLHGLNDSIKAKPIVASIPYFLGAIDQEELMALAKLKGLQKGVENEERKKAIFNGHQSTILDKCRSLIWEAQLAGWKVNDDFLETKEQYIAELLKICAWENKAIRVENQDVISKLQVAKSELLRELNAHKRRRTEAVRMNTSTTEFDSIIRRQMSKLDVHKYFNHSEEKCPVCDSNFTSPNAVSIQIEKSILDLRKEKEVVKKHKPELTKFVRELDEKIAALNDLVSKASSDIENLIKESELAQAQLVENQNITRVVGRISYFLDSHTEVEVFNELKLNEYNNDIKEITSKYGKSQKAEKIQLAERKISTYATEYFKLLPRGLPCLNSEINFFSKDPKIVLQDLETGRDYQFSNIGSDENYLSIHLSLLFALQRFLGEKKSPVPGLLILDQVSRPYYSNDESDEILIEEDDDKVALSRHFKFIFDHVAKISGLQVIILEHAFLSKNEQYKKAAKYRWPRNSDDRLIPSDWPTE
jgi:hypothetical protein